MSILEYSDGEMTFEGFLSIPRGDNVKRPCVLVAHAWDGPNAYFNHLAEQISQLGYVAFAIDVYGKGVRGKIDGDNSHLMNPLLADRSVLQKRLLTAFDFAQSHSTVSAGEIAVLGYCFGGLCALDLARANPKGLKGAISVHGSLTAPQLPSQGPLQSSVLLLHGWEDPIAKPSDFLAFIEEMNGLGADWQAHCYGHAKHAFTFEGADIPSLGIKYNKKAHLRSQVAIETFLREIFYK